MLSIFRAKINMLLQGASPAEYRDTPRAVGGVVTAAEVPCIRLVVLCARGTICRLNSEKEEEKMPCWGFVTALPARPTDSVVFKSKM